MKLYVLGNFSPSSKLEILYTMFSEEKLTPKHGYLLTHFEWLRIKGQAAHLSISCLSNYIKRDMQVYEMKILEQVAVDEHHLIIVFYYLHNSQRRIHILPTLSTTIATLLPMRQSFNVQTREQHISPWCITRTDEMCVSKYLVIIFYEMDY